MKRIITLFYLLFFSGSLIFSNPQNNIPDSILIKIKALNANEKIDYLAKTCWSNREVYPNLSTNLGLYALEIAEKNQNTKRVPELYNYLGTIYLLYRHDITNAIPYYQKARDLSIANKDSIQLGFAYNNLSDLYLISNNIPLAKQFARKSNTIFSSIKLNRGIVYSLRNLGEAFTASQEYETAIEFYTKLLVLETNSNNLSGIINTHISIAETLNSQDKLQESYEHFEIALNLAKTSGRNIIKAKCLSGMAEIHIKNKEYDIAQELTEKAKALNINSSYTPGIIDNKLTLALLLSYNNQKEEGEDILFRAISLANDLGFHTYIINAYHTKAKFYTNLKDFENALISYEEYLTVYDSLYSQQSFESLTEMQKSYNAQRTIETINQNLEAERKDRVYMYVIILLLIILGALILWRYRTESVLNKQLIETNNTKDKLFSIISHDLKSPFNALLGFSDLLNEELEMNNIESAKKYADIINRASKDNYDLINNLLNWSLTQREGIRMSFTDFEIADLINEIISYHRPQAHLKNITLNCEEVETHMVKADRSSMHIILTNLLSNAIKFTGENGRITFQTRSNESNVDILLTDNGVGISEEALQNLFDIKKSKSTPGTNKEKGTGLGLIICKELIDKNGGQLIINSKKGEGSIFMVSLPLS